MTSHDDDLTKVTLSKYMESNPPFYLDTMQMKSFLQPAATSIKLFHAASTDRQTVCVILAAGQGSRFVSETPKVIYPFSADGKEKKPMAAHAISAAQACKYPIILVVGHEFKTVARALTDYLVNGYPSNYMIQENQMGTGHAVYLTKGALPDNYTGNVIVTYADNPGVDAQLLDDLSSKFNELNKKCDGKCSALILTGSRADAGIGAASYGRIVRKTKEGGPIVDIVEKKTIMKMKKEGRKQSISGVLWTAEELDNIDEFNSGIVVAKAKDYFQVLANMVATQTKVDPPKYEYYATDFVKGLVEKGVLVEGWKIPKDRIWRLEGANTVEELDELEQKNADRTKAMQDVSNA